MKLCCVACVGIGAIAGAVLVTQLGAGPEDKKGAQPPMNEKMAEMMKQMEQCMKDGMPGAAHKQMAEFAGTWNAECKMWMDPSMPPQTSKGQMVSKVAMDGRYVIGDYTSEFEGKPFKGMMVWGYNNIEKRYESTWIDNMGSAIMFMTGTASADGKTFTSTGEMAFNKAGGSKSKNKFREVIKVVSPDKHVMEMYCDDGNGERKEMEITYTRAK